MLSEAGRKKKIHGSSEKKKKKKRKNRQFRGRFFVDIRS